MRSVICLPATESRARRFLMVVLAAMLLSLASGCKPAVVRVPNISVEDIKRANTATMDGDLAFARKDIYASLIKYLEAGRLNPNNEVIYNKIGIAYSRLRLYTESFAAFNRSIGLNPKYAYAYNNMGSVYFANNNKKKAESLFRKAISLKNDEASFHMNLGSLYFETKKYEKGLQEWRKGLALDPEILKKTEGAGLVAASSQKNLADRNYFMARLYASTGDVTHAVESLQLALKEGFTNLEALRTEPDFNPVRQNEKFIAFMKYAAQLLKSS
jgi:tetratricopeptide (TPR) repeat protein